MHYFLYSVTLQEAILALAKIPWSVSARYGEGLLHPHKEPCYTVEVM